MRLSIADPELFGVTDTSATVSFVVRDTGVPVDEPAHVLVDGEVRAVSEGTCGTRLVRVEGLAPGTTHRLEIVRVRGDERVAAGADAYFPGEATTLPAPTAEPVASFVTEAVPLTFGVGGLPDTRRHEVSVDVDGPHESS